MFLKTGETYACGVPDLILRGRKDRPRLIWNPHGDTFGVLALINHQILSILSTHESFCYKKTAEDYSHVFS